MCKFISGLVIESGEVLVLHGVHSHNDIIDRYNERGYHLKDDRYDTNFVKWECSPNWNSFDPEKGYKSAKESWEFVLDQDILPKWYQGKNEFYKEEVLKVVDSEALKYFEDYKKLMKNYPKYAVGQRVKVIDKVDGLYMKDKEGVIVVVREEDCDPPTLQDMREFGIGVRFDESFDDGHRLLYEEYDEEADDTVDKTYCEAGHGRWCSILELELI